MAEPLLSPPFDELTSLPAARLRAMRAAATELAEILDEFLSAGRHPVADIISADTVPFTRWSHYPPGDIQDGQTGCLWFYHAHDESESRAWGEHGHFHCFVYTERLGDGARPLALPSQPDFDKGGLVHLAAISFDETGVPLRLFTTNRWVTDEWLYPAGDVIPLLDIFRIEAEPRFLQVSRWLSATIRLFHPQISWLLHERDRVLAEWRDKDPDGFAEDEALEITSVVQFDLDQQIAAIERAAPR